MHVNEGIIDRLIRVLIAIGIIAAFLKGKLPGDYALLLIFSGTFFMSAYTGYCPLYTRLGIKTIRK